MKTILFAVTLLVIAPAQAQPRGAAVGGEVEALVTVIAIDKEKRIVTFRGPRGNAVDMHVPPEAPNFDQVKKGSVFKVKYAEALAVSIRRGGGAPASGEEQNLKLGKKGANPGGMATRTAFVSGRIEAIDLKGRFVAVRGPERTMALQVGDDVKLDELQVGDRITVAYTQALAIEMVPQAKPKPAPKKSEKKS
jgi:hypothetical protein